MGSRFKELIKERYKDGRQWELNFPMNLAEAILNQTRADYVLGKERLICRGEPHNVREGFRHLLEREDYHSDKIERLRTHKERLRDWGRTHEYDVEEVAQEVEQINAWIYESEQEIKRLEEVKDDYMLCIYALDFVNSDWGKSLMMSINLTESDFVKEWDAEAEAKYLEHKDSPILNRGKKLPQEKVDKILELYDQGKSQREIARELGISVEPVRKHTKGRTR